jgi:hypothetical protein
MHRVAATVIGPGASGCLRIRLGQREQDIPVERVPATLRRPNSAFVAVIQSGEFRGVEPAGPAWLVIHQRIEAVLNSSWDPIGVADEVDGEYQSYVSDIYELLQRGVSASELAAHLGQIETEAMGRDLTTGAQRLDVARRLIALELPVV